jgi:tight adherence protein C
LLGILIFFVLGKLDPALLLVAIGIGYIIPDLFVNKQIAKRKNMIAKSLPETVDLLGLCVEAGLDFTSAVKWLIKKVPSNPMIEELTFVLEEIEWGKPRVQALKDMSRRLNIPEVTSFTQALVQAERMGTPVSEAFSILSEDTRMQRFHRGERYALQAPIKILIPLIFCILPVIGIVIGGPIFLQFMQGKLF